MSNLITEIYDKQAVIDNLNQLGELINSSLNAIVASAPKLQSPIEYLTAVQSISEIEKKNTEVTQAKAKAMSDLDKAYQQADKAIQQSINLDDAEFQAQTKLTSQYKERAKEQKQLLELERTRQQTMQNGNKLLQMEAKSEAELRIQQQQLIKAQQSLRVTNAEENALREKLIAKINANKEALKGMSDEVSKQRDNIGNYKSVWDALADGQTNVRSALQMTRQEMSVLEALKERDGKLSAEQERRYRELNIAMGKLTDIQGDMSARAKILADDYRNMTFTMEGIKLGVNIMTSLKAVTALLGNENEELAKTMAQIVAIQQTLSTVTAIQNQLNKDGVIQTNLRLIQEGFIERQTKINTTATIAYGNAQNFAQKASVALKLGVQSVGNAMKAIPIVGWISAAISALMVLYSKFQAARDEQRKAYDETRQNIEEINKKIADSAAESATKFLQLSHSYQKLGDDMKAKEQFIKDNQKAFDDLGVSVTNVKDAEDKLINNKKKFIEAEIAKATAMAAREQAQSLISEILLLKQAQEESTKLGEAQMAIYKAQGMNEYELEKITRTYKDANKEYETEINLRQAQVEKLFDIASILPQVTNATNKERESVEEELTVEEKLYLLRKKINEERETQELPALAKVSVKMKEMADMTDILNGRLQSALHIIQYEYTKAVNEATTAEEKSKLAKEQQRKEIELQIEYSKRMLETLPPQTDEWYKMAKAIEEYKKQLGDLNKYEEPEWLKKANERIEATVDMVNEINNYAQTVSDFQLQRLQEQDEAYDAEYERQKEYINNTVLNEAEKNKKLEALDRQKTAHDKAVAKERAEIERRKAIFDASVQAAQAISHAVGSVGELLATSAGGDAYSAVARYIAAIAAGATAVATVISLVSQMISIPQYAKGGTAEANKPFIAGEKGREIGFGVYSGKMYDFSKPTLFKANEPINIKNATETKQIINNNTEYNKDVTLKNTIMVKVIDNARVVKYFKL